MWVLSAAVYAQARENNPEKVPASLIGESVGLSTSAMQRFRTNLLSRYIPAAVGVLSVVAVGTLVFLGVKALMGWSLFASVISSMTARVNPTVLGALCAAYLLEPIGILAETIYDTAFTATVSFNANFLRDEARETYQRSHSAQMPGEGIVNKDESSAGVPPEYEGKPIVEGHAWEDDIPTNPVVTECC